ncbi:tRNA1(Val) (adenine(37)-N6)-methyltransferase [Campylobacter insulaenigrae]|uniref:tRNA1(Val) (adenine(37)-N6)-methyltransferase n=1 Tax=Campylobacter insulaenigrae TaxID=260714 RepID=UPI0021538048|nr:methyltransferase [Campylobacter insulaenigrae]MCR6593581.1 methyltransferase [Campylobacter insulaenigrae]
MLRLFQYKKGYRYNNDSLLLFNFFSQQNLQGNILDIGCGCGILGLLTKQYFPKTQVYMLDVQEKNIQLTYRNSKENQLEIQTICKDFLDFKSDIKFDYLISNPPFYKLNTTKSENLHLNISRYQEFMPLEKMINKINSLIKTNGKFYMCYDCSFTDEICSYLYKYKIKPTKIQFIYTDDKKPARLVLIEAKKNSKSPLQVLTPIFMYKNDMLSENIKAIYDKLGTISYDIS